MLTCEKIDLEILVKSKNQAEKYFYFHLSELYEYIKRSFNLKLKMIMISGTLRI